jgi:hypothetical protein
MNRTVARFLSLLFAISLLGVLASAASAAPAPAWNLKLGNLPSNLAPKGTAIYFIEPTNVGAAPTVGPVEIEADFPDELTVTKIFAENCSFTAHDLLCTDPGPLGSSRGLLIPVEVEVAAGAAGVLSAEALVRGGGIAQVSRTVTAPVQTDPLAFGFSAEPFSAPLSAEDGGTVSLAGSHPYQQTVSFGFTSESLEGTISNSGHPKTINVDLPAGLLGNPTATPVLCTEAELESPDSCPRASTVGVFGLTSLLGSNNNLDTFSSPLYNMVPPPGYPAALATEAGNVGFTLHLLATVRTDGDYGIEVSTPDVIALTNQPFFAIQVQTWDDPAASAHDGVRGTCLPNQGICPVPPQDTAFWTLPGHCPEQPGRTTADAESWEQPGDFVETEYENADLQGTPTSISGCNQLDFEPTIAAKPTTSLADSPSGLDVELHQPQDTEKEHRYTAQLKDASVTLPPGMAVNPSQADGLAACSSAQIGLTTPIGEAPAHFSKVPAACPDASKLGKAEVTTPLVAEYTDNGSKLVTDPETGDAVPRPLAGSVYLASPFDNPFGSLLAIYLVVEDPRTGTVAKLAGRVEPDPQTGQLTTVFAENPQLPIEDFELHLFGGARGSLITPPVCGVHTTSTTLTPWSSPEGADVHPQSSFQTSGQPGGGVCPTSESAAPNAPSFTAGTLTRQAGAFSPFVFKVSREDGSQRLTGIDTRLAPGMVGKLAGIGQCSEGQIAQAASRSHPNEGILERESPSCPASTRVGTVTVGAGAGPNPFYTNGTAYLAGPYKGAPLSLAIVTPAVAGPFDLGTVVTRVALGIEPETAQIHAVSDPLPTILEGIPLDVRSVALKMDRPDFTLNPTSCDPMEITGTATSALGSTAGLLQRFQVGGCSGLPFKPKLSLRLKGSVKRSSNPKLVATLTAKPGEANIARAQVKLPAAVFLDQSHIGTICTRVQFASDSCPARSVYGKVSASTPLLDYPLAGSVYLRSSSHELPDLVAKLEGPAAQPIEIDLVGKTDAVKGALRNTFEAVPDAPVSKFRLELFGGKRGLVEMSDGFCAHRRATVKLDGQNGKTFDTRPVVAAKCRKGTIKRGHRRAGARR